MSDEIIYRPMTRNDYPAITEMLCRAWYDDSSDWDISYKVAQADFEYCLAQTTTALVAQSGENVVGVILGRIDSQETRPKINKHHGSTFSLLFPLHFSAEGREKVKKFRDSVKENAKLMKEAKKEGKAYDAQIVLFLVKPSFQNQGIGKHLFDWLLDEFKKADVKNYFLYTDTTCDTSFYEKRGLNRRDIPLQDDPQTVQEEDEVHDEDYVKEEHLHALMFDNEVSPANEGVNPLGRD